MRPCGLSAPFPHKGERGQGQGMGTGSAADKSINALSLLMGIWNGLSSKLTFHIGFFTKVAWIILCAYCVRVKLNRRIKKSQQNILFF